MRKIGLLAVAAVAIAVLAFLFGHLIALTDEQRNPPKIIALFSSSDPKEVLWQQAMIGARTAADEFRIDLKVIGPRSQNDIREQMLLLEEAIREKPDAIVVEPIDLRQLSASLENARKAKIAVIIIASSADSASPDHAVVIDHFGAGVRAGELLAESNGSAKVALLRTTGGSRVGTERERGLREVLSRNAAFTIVETSLSEHFEEQAYEAAKELLTRHPDLGVIVGLDDIAVTGAAKAIKEKKLVDNIRVIGFDSSIYEMMLLEEGVLSGTVVERTFHMGYLGVKSAVDRLNGQRRAKPIVIDSLVITKDNMYDPANQRLLFPFPEG